MASTKIKVEDVIGDVINKDNFSHDQIIELKSFLAKMI